MKAPSKTIFKKRKRIKFTQIDNKPLQEKGLSLEAVGLLACVMSMPDNFEFGREWARWRFDIGREKVDRVIKELKEAGYIRFEQERDQFNRLGKSIYTFTDEAGCFEDEEPLPENPCYGSAVAGKPDRKAGNGPIYNDKNKKRGASRRSNGFPGGAEPVADTEPLTPAQREMRVRALTHLKASLRPM